MLTRIEVTCAKCERDLLVDVREYCMYFLGKKSVDRICEDCATGTVECPWCNGSGYGRDEGPDTKFCGACKGEGRLTPEKAAEGRAWERERNVCPDCQGKGGTAVTSDGHTVHYCNCEVDDE